MRPINNHFKLHQDVLSRLICGDLRAVSAPLVSIAIPTFRRADLLQDAINSALLQTGVDFPYEVIVVDNDGEGGEDGETAKLIRQYEDPRLLYYRNEKNLGMFGNWNRFFELARGKWVVMLHDDDVLSSFYLKTIAPIIAMDSADIVHFAFIHFKGKVPDFPDCSPADYQKTAQFLNPAAYLRGNISSGVVGALCRKEAVINSGGFDESYYPSADYEYWARASRHFRLVRYPELVVGGYRQLVNVSNEPKTIRATTLQNARIKMRLAELVESPIRRWLIKIFVIGHARKVWLKRQKKHFNLSDQEWIELCQTAGGSHPQNQLFYLLFAPLIRQSILKRIVKKISLKRE